MARTMLILLQQKWIDAVNVSNVPSQTFELVSRRTSLVPNCNPVSPNLIFAI